MWNWLRIVLRRKPPSLGRRGEAHAAAYLKKQGYRIIAKNRTHKKGEIDLIALDKTALVFVEVRTRTSEWYMTPEASIRSHKRRTVINTVRRLLKKRDTLGLTPRIDVIAIIWPKGAPAPTTVRHHKAVMPIGTR